MKKWISLVLVLAMLLTYAAPAFAANDCYFPAYKGKSNSLVDALKSVGADSSYSARSEIAEANGVTPYSGTPAQNTRLLNLLREGKLLKPGANLSGNSGSANCYPACKSSHTSIVNALKSIGVDSSYANRQRIAAANGITGYKGSAKQNTQMLNMLKKGVLVNPDSRGAQDNETKVTEKAKESSYLVEVTKANAPLRTEANKYGKTIQKFNKGDCLTVIGTTVNSSGNLWYQIWFGNETGWIYSGNVTIHEHKMVEVEDVPLALCHCGYYETWEEGMTHTAADVLTGWLISPEVIAAIQSAGLLLAEGASAVAPYVAVVVVAGIVIEIVINKTATQADVDSISDGMKRFQKDRGEKEKYYYCKINGPSLLINYSNPIDIEDANRFLMMAAMKHSLLSDKNFLSIYTPDEDDARKLAERFTKNVMGNLKFNYGNSKRKHKPEINNDWGTPLEGYFYHYHLFVGDQEMNKASGVHIFYGDPYDCKSVPVAA